MSGLVDMAGDLFEFAAKVAHRPGAERPRTRSAAVRLTDRYTCDECDGVGDDSQETGVTPDTATDCKECDGAGTMPELREAVTIAWQVLDMVGTSERDCCNENPLHSLARKLALLIVGDNERA